MGVRLMRSDRLRRPGLQGLQGLQVCCSALLMHNGLMFFCFYLCF